MPETTELSPAVENRKGIDKDSDVSKSGGVLEETILTEEEHARSIE